MPLLKSGGPALDRSFHSLKVSYYYCINTRAVHTILLQNDEQQGFVRRRVHGNNTTVRTISTSILKSSSCCARHSGSHLTHRKWPKIFYLKLRIFKIVCTLFKKFINLGQLSQVLPQVQLSPLQLCMRPPLGEG